MLSYEVTVGPIYLSQEIEAESWEAARDVAAAMDMQPPKKLGDWFVDDTNVDMITIEEVIE